MQDPDLIRILTFHGLGTPSRPLPAGEDHYWLEGSIYEAILDLVKNRPDVLITFDDSNVSDFVIALPALLARQMTATFFVVSERINQPGFLTTAQILEMAQAGMSIGSHGTQHRPWATLGPKDLHDELTTSRKVLEDLLGRPIREAACPFGSYNRRVLHALRVAGYERVYTSDQGPAHRHEWLSARNTVTRPQPLQYARAALGPPVSGLPAALRSVKLMLKRWR